MRLSTFVVHLKHHPARDTDAHHIYPARHKVEKMGVEQGTNYVLHHSEQSDPCSKPIAAKHQEMHEPHGIEDRASHQTPLNRNVQRLVVWVADSLLRKSRLPDCSAAEKSLRRAGAVAGQRRVLEKDKRFSPELQPHPNRSYFIACLILGIFKEDAFRPALKIG